jgi:hypothetical protein
VQTLLIPDEMAALDKIVAQLARTGHTATRSAALRWCLAELATRLDLARMARGAMPAFTAPGPIAPPPD